MSRVVGRLSKRELAKGFNTWLDGVETANAKLATLRSAAARARAVAATPAVAGVVEPTADVVIDAEVL